MANSPKEELLPVAAARSGNPEAWDILFHRYQLPLYAFVFEGLRDEQSSLDAVQETFIKASKYLHQLQVDEKFVSWIFSIAHQTCTQFARRRRPTEPIPEDLDSSPEFFDHSIPPSEALEHDEDEAELLRYLGELPREHRAALTLYYLEEFSIQEISEIVGAPLGTVKSRLHYAKTSLRRKCLARKELKP